MEDEKNFEEEPYHFFNKPSLILRIKSIFIDSFIIILLMYLAFLIFNNISVESGKVKGMALLIIFLYEPVLITTGRTIGQRIMGLRVRKYSAFVNGDEKININIFYSLFRYMIKILLGWLSLLTIHSDKYGQAIHDKIGDSLMTIE